MEQYHTLYQGTFAIMSESDLRLEYNAQCVWKEV